MGLKIGDIEVVDEVIDLRYQLIRTQLLLEELIKLNNNLMTPSIGRIQEIDNQAFQTLQQRFPNMGIQRQQ